MADYFSKNGGSSGNYFGGKSPSPHHSSGLLGAVLHALSGPGHLAAHLGNDIMSAAAGIPEGMVTTAEHPLRASKGILAGVWHDWSPLFHGHVGQWASNFYAHPLAPLLDIASVAGLAAAPFTGGASLSLDVADGSLNELSLAGKVGRLAKTGSIEYRMPARTALQGHRALSAAVEAGKMTPEEAAAGIARPSVTRQLAKSPVARVRQAGLHVLIRKLEPHMPDWYAKTVGSEGTFERRFHPEVQRRAGALVNDLKDPIAQASAHEQAINDTAVHANTAMMVDAGKKLFSDNLHERHAWWGKVFEHNYAQLRTHAMRVPDLGPGMKLPKGFRYVRNMHPSDLNPEVLPSSGMYADKLEHFSTKALTSNRVKAARAAGGDLMIVPKHTMDSLYGGGAKDARFLGKLVTAPGHIWKYLAVGATPKMAANVTLGNMFFMMSEHSPLTLGKAFLDSTRQALGSGKALGEMEKGFGGHYNPDWLHSNFRDVLDHTGAAENILGPRAESKLGKVKQGFYPLVAKGEQMMKRFSLKASLMEAPEVKALMKEGKSFHEAAPLALKGNPTLRAQVAKRALDTVGDYRIFNRHEKAIQNVLPFYTWDRHAIRHVARLMNDHPAQLDALARGGELGNKNTLKELGTMPSYMQSILSLGHHGGKDLVLNTAGLNPYTTAGDLAQFVTGMSVGHTTGPLGEAVGGEINPILRSAIEHLSGKRLTTEQPVSSKGGLISSVLADVGSSVPEFKIPKTLISGTPQPKPNARTGKTTPFLLSKDAKTQVAALLGVPVKKINLQRAHDLYDKEHGIHKRRKSGRNYFGS